LVTTNLSQSRVRLFFLHSQSHTMRKIFSICLLFVLVQITNAQSGRISGTILDAKTGETLPGAVILIEGTTRGASADFDGKFSINNVPVGNVNLVVSYISYSTKKISGVTVTAGDPVDVNVKLEPSASNDLNEVEIVVTLSKENNTALVLQQKNNSSVSDGISAETIRRTPDKNTSDVLKRVSGASIQDNKFAIVRGLNERYNAAYLNGAPLPSTESDRKAFSFDLFPSNMLDNLVITKTARPDLPGEFAGGIIEINTKNIPEKNFVNVSVGSGYHGLATGNERLYYNGGKRDWLGLDDGTRALSSNVPSYLDFPNDVNVQGALAKQVPASDWGIYKNTFLPNANFQASAGWNYKKKERDFIGILGSLSYNNNNSFFSTERLSYLGGSPNDKLDPLILDKEYLDKTYQTQKLIGGLLNASCKINDNNSISFKNLYSIATDDRVIERTGTTTPLEKNRLLVRSTALWFTQNNALTSQLIGDHYIPAAKIKINWNANYAKVKRIIPNLRRHTYTRLSFLENKAPAGDPEFFDPNDTIWKAEVSTSGSSSNDYSGVMMWSSLDESIYNGKLDVSQNYKVNKDLTIDGKIGGFYQLRERDFDFRQLIYSQYGGFGGTTTFSTPLVYLPENQIFTAQNMGVITPSTASSNQVGGFKLVEATLPQSGYKAGSNLTAGYLMADIKYHSFLRLVTGVRVESYRQKLEYFDNLYLINEKIIKQDTLVTDILPSANLIVSPTDKINLRGSYSKTVNRPEFRELAPFLFYDFNTQFSLNGDPYLKRSVIDNYDLRFEWYPGAGQLISVSGFYKKFINPIELSKAQNPTALIYKNVPTAFCQGIELEYRLTIGKFHNNDSSAFGRFLDNMTLFTNLALIQSKIDRTNTESTYDRPMQGQSPYLFNGGFSYIDNKYNFSFSAMYNRVGQRIYIVGNDQFEEVWEKPRNLVDFQVTKSLLNNKLDLRFNVKDLLANNQPLQYVQNFDNKRLKSNSNNTAPFWTQRMAITLSFQAVYKF